MTTYSSSSRRELARRGRVRPSDGFLASIAKEWHIIIDGKVVGHRPLLGDALKWAWGEFGATTVGRRTGGAGCWAYRLKMPGGELAVRFIRGDRLIENGVSPGSYWRPKI